MVAYEADMGLMDYLPLIIAFVLIVGYLELARRTK